MDAKQFMVLVAFVAFAMYFVDAKAIETDSKGNVILTIDEARALQAEIERMQEIINTQGELLPMLIKKLEENKRVDCI